MSYPTRTKEQKVGDWLAVYSAIREEITPGPFRALLSLSNASDPAATRLGIEVAKIVFANERVAAQVAAILIEGPTRRSDFGEDAS